MDRLLAMKVFVKVADTQGFAGAARQLLMSPPAVTRAIAALEDAVGARLLVRTTRSVKTTEAGARYLDDCRRILAEIEEAEAAAAGSHATPSGMLTVTAPNLFGAMHVMPVVTHYLRQYPAVTVQTMFVDRLTHLAEEGIDVAVRIGHLPDSAYRAIPVGTVRLMLCAAPGYLKRAGTPRTPAELARHTLIASVGSWSSQEWRFGPSGARTTVAVRPRLLCNTNEGAIAAAVDGFGIARVLSYQVAADIAAKRLRHVLASHEEPPFPVHVVHAEGRRVSAKARAFIDLAVELLRANPAIATADRQR